MTLWLTKGCVVTSLIFAKKGVCSVFLVTLFLSALRQKYAVGVLCLAPLWSRSDHVWWWRWRSARLLTSPGGIIQTSCECPRAPTLAEASSGGRTRPWLLRAAFHLSHVGLREIYGHNQWPCESLKLCVTFQNESVNFTEKNPWNVLDSSEWPVNPERLKNVGPNFNSEWIGNRRPWNSRHLEGTVGAAKLYGKERGNWARESSPWSPWRMASRWSLRLHCQGRCQEGSKRDCWSSLNSYISVMSHHHGILSQEKLL